MVSESTTVLVTGANRGVGKSFIEHYLSQENHTVIAGVRNPDHPTAKALYNLSKGSGSTLLVVKIDGSSDSDAKLAVKELESKHGIAVIDTVVANAGIANATPAVKATEKAELLEHFQVNTFAVILLFQAVLPLLEKSSNPKFITVSTLAASIDYSDKLPFPNTVYGISKVALNYVTRRIHIEHPNIIAIPIHPGLVKTDMGNRGSKELGLEKMMEEIGVTPEQSVAGMVSVIDQATRDKFSGEFMSYDGTVLPW